MGPLKKRFGCLEGCGVIVLLGIIASAAGLLMFRAGGLQSSPVPATASLETLKKDLYATPWVRDIYIASGHANVGVFAEEKDWSSPSIGRFVCAKAKAHGASGAVTWVRLVDSRKVAAGESPVGAEIAKIRCDYEGLP